MFTNNFFTFLHYSLRFEPFSFHMLLLLNVDSVACNLRSTTNDSKFKVNECKEYGSLVSCAIDKKSLIRICNDM